jgi:type IV secretion system protein VirB5
MRRALLAGVCVVALAAPARSQMAVFDGANFGNTLRSVYQGAQQLQQMEQQIATLRQSLDQQIATLNGLVHLPQNELNQLASTFNTSIIRSPLPGSSDLSGIVSGLQGTNNALSGLTQQFQSANRIYTPYGGDFSANAMATNASSIAGVQAAVQQLIASAQQHSQALQGIEGQLSGATDAKAVADIQARLALESVHIQSQGVQAQALATMQNAQVRLTDQQRQEARRCYIEAMLNGTDTTQDTCARPASQGAVQLASAGTGSGSSVASAWQAALGQSVGSGQCVAYVQSVTDVGLTRTWTQGAQVLGNSDIPVGTAIATFDAGGKYANAVDGSSHAAIYLGQDASGGIRVADQWLGHNVSERVISPSGSTQANSAGAFYVISH